MSGVLPLGAFSRGLQAARRGFDRAGLARSFGQNPTQRRALAPFGGTGGFAQSSGRSDFSRGGILGQQFGGRSAFGGLKSVFSQDDTYGTDGLFGDVSWDPATGLRRKGGDFGGGGPMPGGGAAQTAGGSWAALDKFNSFYNSAASSTGAPANLVKAIHNAESSGVHRSDRYLRGEYVYGFNGIFQSTAASHGIDWNRMHTDDAYAVWAIGKVMQGIAGWQDPAGSGQTIGQKYGWEGVAKVYFGGKGALTGTYYDEDGKSSNWYGDTVVNNWRFLESQSGSYAGNVAGTGMGMGGSGASGGGWSSAIWGGGNAPVTYEFNAPSVNGSMYNYGSAHGTNGWSHPGVDVGVARGTTLYAAKNGTVSCVGQASAGIGGTGGGSCGYFSDEGGGVGNVTIKFDDGSFLVYGHSSSSLVQPGQRVSAGQAVALSGGLQGDHVHLEYRVPGTCASGYCVADPRTMGNWQTGYSPGGQTGGGTNVGGVQASNGATYSPGYQIPSRIPR